MCRGYDLKLYVEAWAESRACMSGFMIKLDTLLAPARHCSFYFILYIPSAKLFYLVLLSTL